MTARLAKKRPHRVRTSPSLSIISVSSLTWAEVTGAAVSEASGVAEPTCPCFERLREPPEGFSLGLGTIRGLGRGLGLLSVDVGPPCWPLGPVFLVKREPKKAPKIPTTPSRDMFKYTAS